MIDKFQIIWLLDLICHLSLGFWIFMMNPAYVFAQSLSLSVSPPSLEIIIKPGISLTYAFKINNGGDSVILTPTINKLNEFGLIDDPHFIPDNWISFINNDISLNKSFVLNKGASEQLVLRVNPPANIGEEDYYRALVFTSKPNPASDSSGSTISESLAVPLLISITSSGVLDRSASITQFSVSTILDSFDPLNIDISIKNRGKSFFHPNGKITFSGPLGESNYSIIPEVVLPNQEKKLTTDFNDRESNHTLSLSGFYLGKYTVSTDFRLDDGKINIGERKTVYALPIKAGLVMLLLIVIIMTFHKKRRRLPSK